MKRYISLICVLLLLILLAACGQAQKSPQLTMTVSTWSGWSPDYEPTAEEYVFDVDLELTIHLPESNLLAPTFTVLSVTENEIIIHSDCALSLENESGESNLLTDQQDFSIPYGKSITLHTPSMDAGLIYTFTYTAQGDISE